MNSDSGKQPAQPSRLVETGSPKLEVEQTLTCKHHPRMYYKFNEGITGTSSVDNVVLDYGGRVVMVRGPDTPPFEHRFSDPFGICAISEYEDRLFTTTTQVSHLFATN